jgi:hypothetical protein
MRDNGPENPTLHYPRSIDERLSRLETAVNWFKTVAARFVGLEGRQIAVEGRLSALEAWFSESFGPDRSHRAAARSGRSRTLIRSGQN